ncbi:MAG: prepilin-type N-terminal cleavage/methylation domain-containing protein [Akkermansia sp.]|nr:prepilin-type N-terminal cleavage/methylation domain-containing protein [Akkermansia sp.]
MKLAKPYSKSGFTLMEILIVIAILAFLAAGVWEAKSLIEGRQLRSTAQTQIAQLETAMNAYRADNGDVCPYGRGDEWSSHVLYEALSCDEDNDGEPDKEKGSGVTRMPYCETLVIVDTKSGEQMEGIPVVKKRVTSKADGKRIKGKYYLIFDPWGKPYRYRLGCEMSDDKGRVGSGINPDFDIFSLGADGLGNGLTNDNENEDNISNIRSWK